MKYLRAVLLLVALTAVAALLTGCPFQNIPPVASFTATPNAGPGPLSVVFDATGSTDPDGTIASYSWTFGDGQNGTGVGGTHIYEDEGVYTAILTVIDNAGAMATASQEIHVAAPANAAPTASFTTTPATGSAPLTVQFNAAASSDPDGTIASYTWSFGDGNNGSGVTTLHTYNSAGTYVAILTVADDDGATASTTHSIEVTAPGNAVPMASFTATPESGAFPLSVAFDASGSTDPDGTISSYNWTFGDGHSGSGKTASHTFSTYGTFTVILTVIDNDGAPASAYKTIHTYYTFQPIQPPFIPPINPIIPGF